MAVPNPDSFSDTVTLLQEKARDLAIAINELKTLVDFFNTRGWKTSGAQQNVQQTDLVNGNSHITVLALDRFVGQFQGGLQAFWTNQVVTQRDYQNLLYDILREAPLE